MAAPPESIAGKKCGIERIFVATFLIALPAVILTQLIAAAVAAVVGIESNSIPTAKFAILAVLVVAVVVPANTRLGWLPGLAARLPASIDGALRRRPVVVVAWCLLAVFCLQKVARLSCFMTDHSLIQASALPFISASIHHQCLPAYLYAAEMNARGEENVYEKKHYTGEEEERPEISTDVRGMRTWISDVFYYPPPFLLVPHTVLAVTDSYALIRTTWFACNTLGFMLVALLVSRWVGGREGRLTAWMLPLLALSIPTLLDLQQGQVHLAAIVLAVGGMLAFENNRRLTGGALLAAALVAKIFPAFLLLILIFQKRWRDVISTGVFCVVYTLLGLSVLGTGVFESFFGYELPRLLNGEAFFLLKDPTPFIVNINLSVAGTIFKLRGLGLPGMTDDLARTVNLVYSVVLVGLVIVAAKQKTGRAGQAAIWLAVVNLGALRSALAPMYVACAVHWLLILLVARFAGAKWRIVVFVLVFTLMNVAPIGLVLSLLGQAVVMAICLIPIFRPNPRPVATYEEVDAGPLPAASLES